MIKKISQIICLLALFVASEQLTTAQPIQYSYSGPAFSFGTGPFLGANVSGTVTLSGSPAPFQNIAGNPLGNTIAPNTPTIDSFSFTSDGLTIDSGNYVSGNIDLTFDASGSITDWIVTIDGPAGSNIGTNNGFFGQDIASAGGETGDGGFGSWSDAQVIPEPTSLAVWSVIAGMGLVVGWSRTRKKKHQKPPG